MALSFGPGGGVQDPNILRLLAELSALVKSNNENHKGAEAPVVLKFIEEHEDVIFVDVLTQCMHTFKEIAEPMSLMFQGFKFELGKKRDLPGDSWQEGKVEDMFGKKNPDEPADWWK